MSKPFRQRNAATYAHFGPNMTPMVDVVMVILIFFMASAALMGPEWLLRAALPRPQAATPPANTVPVAIRVVMKDGAAAAKIAVGVGAAAADCSMNDLDAMIVGVVKQHGAANLAVAISADDAVPYEGLVHVHERCVAAGITRIALPEVKQEVVPPK